MEIFQVRTLPTPLLQISSYLDKNMERFLNCYSFTGMAIKRALNRMQCIPLKNNFAGSFLLCHRTYASNIKVLYRKTIRLAIEPQGPVLTATNDFAFSLLFFLMYVHICKYKSECGSSLCPAKNT